MKVLNSGLEWQNPSLVQVLVLHLGNGILQVITSIQQHNELRERMNPTLFELTELIQRTLTTWEERCRDLAWIDVAVAFTIVDNHKYTLNQLIKSDPNDLLMSDLACRSLKIAHSTLLVLTRNVDADINPASNRMMSSSLNHSLKVYSQCFHSLKYKAHIQQDKVNHGTLLLEMIEAMSPLQQTVQRKRLIPLSDDLALAEGQMVAAEQAIKRSLG